MSNLSRGSLWLAIENVRADHATTADLDLVRQAAALPELLVMVGLRRVFWIVRLTFQAVKIQDWCAELRDVNTTASSNGGNVSMKQAAQAVIAGSGCYTAPRIVPAKLHYGGLLSMGWRQLCSWMLTKDTTARIDQLYGEGSKILAQLDRLWDPRTGGRATLRHTSYSGELRTHLLATRLRQRANVAAFGKFVLKIRREVDKYDDEDACKHSLIRLRKEMSRIHHSLSNLLIEDTQTEQASSELEILGESEEAHKEPAANEADEAAEHEDEPGEDEAEDVVAPAMYQHGEVVRTLKRKGKMSPDEQARLDGMAEKAFRQHKKPKHRRLPDAEGTL